MSDERNANARRPAEWQPPDDGRLYTLVACGGCGTGYPVRYLAQLEDGRYLCRACFDAIRAAGYRIVPADRLEQIEQAIGGER